MFEPIQDQLRPKDILFKYDTLFKTDRKIIETGQWRVTR